MAAPRTTFWSRLTPGLFQKPTRLRCAQSDHAKIRPYQGGDWYDFHELMVSGHPLNHFTTQAVREALAYSRDSECPIEFEPNWPTGGIWTVECGGEVVCAVRVFIFRDRAQIRNALALDVEYVQYLTQLLRHVVHTAVLPRWNVIVHGPDVSASQLRLILGDIPIRVVSSLAEPLDQGEGMPAMLKRISTGDE